MTYLKWMHEDLKWLNQCKQDCRKRYYQAKSKYQGQGIGWELMKQAFVEEKRFWDNEIHNRKNKLKERLYGKGF